MLHSKWILVGVVILIAFISMARFPFDTHFTDRHHNQLVHFTVYPASSLPEGLRSPLLHFAPPKCMRVKSAHWTEDALILDSEYNCSLEPIEKTYKRQTPEGEDTIIVLER